MVGGTGGDAREVDSAAAAADWGADRVALFFGHRAAERPDEGWDIVWAGVDLALPGRVEALVLPAGATRRFGDAVSDLLLGDGEGDLVAGVGGGGGTCRVNVRGDRAA